MDRDGIDDLGLYAPDQDTVSPDERSEWFFLLSGDPDDTPAIQGTLNKLDHPFDPSPRAGTYSFVSATRMPCPSSGTSILQLGRALRLLAFPAPRLTPPKMKPARHPPPKPALNRLSLHLRPST